MSVDHLELQIAWNGCVGDPVMFESLLARHRESHRRYHGVRHMVWVVRHATELSRSEPVTDSGAVTVAAFFHDAVYDPKATDNERASARLATIKLEAAGWPPDRIDRVARMIEATAGHHRADDADTAVLLDADLAVLGAEPGAYQGYVNGVRAEYRHLDAARWIAGRRSFLAKFLERDRIFHTETGRNRWEQRARANLAAEIASLA